MKVNLQNPKGSNVCKDNKGETSTTPLGSNVSFNDVVYKHVIPSGLEKEIMENLKNLNYE